MTTFVDPGTAGGHPLNAADLNMAFAAKADRSYVDAAIAAIPGATPTWTAVTGKPTFATVATSGAYADLTNKPSFATVAITGAYADLSGKPTIPTVPGSFTSGAAGLVPASGGGTTNFLRADGSFAVPPSAGGGASVGSATPLMDGVATVGDSTAAAHENHVHPTDTSRYAASNPSGYQTAAQVGTLIAAGTAANVSGTVALANGGTGATTQTGARSALGLGTAAVLNSGTTTGTLADGGTVASNTSAITANTTAIAARLVAASNLSDVASAASARTNLGLAPIAFGVSFDQGAIVANGTIVVSRKAPFAFTINSLDYEVGSAAGSFTVAVQINGTSVTGLSAVAVSSATTANAAASAANAVAAGDKVTFLISAVSGSPTGANLQLNGTR